MLNGLSKTQSVLALFVVLSAILAVGFKRSALPSAQEKDDTPVLMRAKLASSKKVLEGLVTENFDQIKSGADEMQQLSHVKHWPRSDDAIYQFLSKKFRGQCKKLAKQAETMDLFAAQQTHVAMTTTCVECHTYVRGNFKIQPNKISPKGPVQLIPTYWDKDK